MVKVMKRKIYNEILKWKENSNGTTALLIEGARRVGKSYIVEEFAKKNYKSYLMIDFSKVSNEIKELFENYLDNLDYLYIYHNIMELNCMKEKVLLYLMRYSFVQELEGRLNI